MHDRMKIIAIAATAIAASAPASAHIEYYDLNQGLVIENLTDAGRAIAGNSIPLSNPAHWTVANQSSGDKGETWTSLGGAYASGTWGWRLEVVDLDSASWTDGLRNNPTGGANLLGDSHKLGLANFHLSQATRISIVVSDTLAGTGLGLNPSISLYRGSAVYQGHDGSAADPLNPKSGAFPFPKVQNAKDTGTVVDSQGIPSAYRNTLTNTGEYIGQFNATGGWSIANDAGDWSAVEYITSVTGSVDPTGGLAGNSNANSLLDYLLPAGDYIIAFGGNAQPASYSSTRSASSSSPFGVLTNQGATLTFQAVAVPVPEPGTWLLTGAGLGFLALVGRRRSRRAS